MFQVFVLPSLLFRVMRVEFQFGRKPSALDPVFLLAWFKAPPAAQLLIPTAYGKEKGVLGSPITHFSPEL